MFCREQVARLSKRVDEIHARGHHLVAIGNGAPYMAKAFAENENITFPLYTDPGKDAYKALGLKNSKAGILKPAVWKRGLRATMSGHKQTGVRGDPFQNGGLAVVGPDGTLRFLHVDDDMGDHADLDSVIAGLDPA